MKVGSPVVLALVSALICITTVGAAVAQLRATEARPQTLPSRDVTVVYRLDGAAGQAIPGGVPGTLRLSWNAAGQILRVEPEGRRQTLLVDLRAHTAEVLDSGLKTAMSLPVREKDLQPVTLNGANLARRGRDVVAGIGCTDYAAQSSRGHGTVCFTADGVPLRASGEVNGQQGSFTAISVAYGAVAPSAFQVPAGYHQLDLGNLLNPR